MNARRAISSTCTSCSRARSAIFRVSMPLSSSYFMKIYIDYVTNIGYKICILAQEGASPETTCRRSQEWRPRLRRESATREVRTPTARAVTAWRGQSLTAPVAHCRRRQRGSAAENRHGGAPRGRPGCNGTARVSLTRIVAPRTRDTREECACRRSTPPRRGVGFACRSESEGGCEKEATTDAKCVAGRKKAEPFDIVTLPYRLIPRRTSCLGDLNDARGMSSNGLTQRNASFMPATKVRGAPA
jgi:hypothetical protein